MKKIFILLIAVLFVSSASAQTTCGALSGDETWSSNVHVTCDVTVGNGITLTISPGVTVSFDAGASLIITGSGRLNANGSSGSKITFTAFGSSWGHLYFNNTTAAANSIINYCIIEKGDARSLSPAYGGGIHANTSKLVVSNSLIQNNNAVYGGGIFVNQSMNPSISNCIIYSNIATEGGGGLYFWNNSYSTVTNCIIDNNSVTGTSYGGGGMLIGPSSGSLMIVNCVITRNTATNSYGDEVYFYSSDNARLINSIFWNTNANSSYYGATSNNFVNSAIKGGFPSNSLGCIALNSNNNAGDGPNFNATNGSDWSIKVISPCLDAGTSSNAPLTDYLGNSRVRNYDIGAYEVQYNYWLTSAGSTDWATGGNWNGGVPGSSQNIVITTGATNYPTGSSSQNHTINTGYGIVLESGAKATLGTLTNNGDLKLESDATTVSSLIVTSFSGSGAIVELNLNGGEQNPGTHDYRWHYISTPVASIVIADIFQPVTYNVLGWYDDRVTGTLITGWAAYDGWLYYTVPPGYGGPTFPTLTPGKGYDYYASSDHEYTFSGQLNTGDFPMALTFASPQNANLNGYNLLGNPYSSGLDWDEITYGTYAASYPSNTSKGLNFTKNNISIYYNNGISVPDGATGIIPPMQGFFVKTYSTGNSITIPAGARTHSINPVRYKGSQIIPLVRLSVTENGISDEAVVRFDALAKSGLDFDFDAVKMGVSTANTQIYSTSGNLNYAINGQPFPQSSVEIPIVVNLLTAGNHSINTLKLQGLDNYKVTLTDKLNNNTVDLKTSPSFSFTSVAGTFTNRFVLKVSNVLTGVEDPVVSKNTFNIYPANNFINIQTISDNWDGKTGTVRVMDLTGKNISNLNNTEYTKNSLIQVEAPAAKGLYVVEIRSGVMRYVGKVIIR